MKEVNKSIISNDDLNFGKEDLFINSIPQIKIVQNMMYATFCGDSNDKVELITNINPDDKKSNYQNYNSDDEKALFIKDLDGGNCPVGNEIARLSYKMLGGTLTKCFTYPFGEEYFFAYNKNTGYFSRNMNEKLKVFGEMRREILTQKEFYSELLRRIKARLIMGYFSVDESKPENTSEKIDGVYYLRRANKKAVMRNLKLNVFEVYPYINALEKSSYIPEEYHNTILQELCRAVYVGELRADELKNLRREAEAELKSEEKKKLPSFKNKKLRQKLYKDMQNAQANMMFTIHDIEMELNNMIKAKAR